MSLLQLKMRPWTEFNPANEDHRRWYAQYLRDSNWGGCPVRFVDPTDCGNLAMSIQASMVKYYCNKEFKTLPKKAKNIVKTVDILAV